MRHRRPSQRPHRRTLALPLAYQETVARGLDRARQRAATPKRLLPHLEVIATKDGLLLQETIEAHPPPTVAGHLWMDEQEQIWVANGDGTHTPLHRG